MSGISRWAWAGLVAAVAAAPCAAGDSFADLLRRVPPQANAVLLIDADALHRGPHAAREGWATNHDRDSLHGADSLPAGVERLVVAALVNPTTLDHVWKVGIGAT